MKTYRVMYQKMFLAFASMILVVVSVSDPSAEEAVRKYSHYQGPKKTISVAKFDAHGAFVAKYGGWDIGGGLSAQLVSELNRTNRFIVVDRFDLKAVLREQKMALQNLTNNQVAGAGQLLGAEYLIRGSITQFEQNESGGGLSFGISLPGFGGAISPQVRNGTVGLDIRIIDTTSGRIVNTYTLQKEVSGMALALDGSTGKFNFGGDVFKKTALGQATREAIVEAVARIVEGMDAVPWQALVARVKGSRVYVNAGQNANLKKGDRLAIYRVVDRITDPATQEVLGIEERQIGMVQIDRVAQKYAVGITSGEGMELPQRGDILRYQVVRIGKLAKW